jgi:transposase
MFFEELTDDEWARLAPLAADEPMHPHRRGRPRAEPRVVANAVLWILTTGERWSKLPARYPSGPTCRRRFDDWLADGTLAEIVKVLSEFGRRFAYVPQPETMPQPAPKAAPVSVPESPRLRGVFWTNPESWQSTNELDEAEAERHQNSIDNACLHTVPAASSRRAPTPGVQLRVDGDRSHGAPLVDSITVTRHSQAYRDYIVHASAQPVAKEQQVSYRASAEIVKEGRRIERSGLIGPRFADNESAERYALDWARDWIDRHEAAAAQHRPQATHALPMHAAPQPPTEVEVENAETDAEAAPAMAAANTPPTRVLEPSVIMSRTHPWLVPSHAEGRGDTKPPELLYHA